MKYKSDSILYITIGSIIMGIISASLFIMGYFPNPKNILLTAVIAALVILVYVMFASITVYCSDKVISKIIIPLIISIFGTSISSVLTLSTILNINAKSTILLFFLTSVFFTFMCCYFYKIIIWIFYEHLKNHQWNSTRFKHKYIKTT